MVMKSITRLVGDFRHTGHDGEANLWWDQGRKTTPGDEAHCDPESKILQYTLAMRAQSEEPLGMTHLMRSIAVADG